MVRHLFAPIIGQRFPLWGGHLREILRKAPIRTDGNRAVHADQQHQARCSFHFGAHGRAIAGASQQVAFPVTGDGLGGDVGRPFGDWGHVGNLAPAVLAAHPLATGLVGLPQGSHRFAPQRFTRQHVQRRSHGFWPLPGAGYSGPVLGSAPSFGANARGLGLDSRSFFLGCR